MHLAGEGLGKRILSVARSADLVLLVLDVFQPYHEEILVTELANIGIRLNQNPPNVVIEKPVYPRMSEIVLERTFEIKDGVKLLEDAGHKVSLTDSQYAFHINSHGVDKGSGLREAMHMLAVESKDLIAIGDSITDVPMFNVAKTSIALGNASEYVRSKATMTVDSKAGDGLLDAMDLLGPKMAGNIQ